jgi:hypothetical protein
VPDVFVADAAGSVPGPLDHVTLCPLDGVFHSNVTMPAGMVSGVGLKKSFPTVIVVE